MVLEESPVAAESVQQQIDRILHSEQFRSSEVLRRLLAFLAERALAGEADTLKEYVVAIDGLGKSASYDPQHNSTVRIQMGRLRQRLAEYYRSEGRNDPIIIDLPKGRFRVTFEQRSGAATAADKGAVLDISPETSPGSIGDLSHKPAITAQLPWGRIVSVAGIVVGALLLG